MRTVNWGIIGLGLISKEFMIPEMLKSDICRITALGSRSKIADDYLPEAKHLTYDELFEDPDVEAVYIAVPNALHAELAIKAMKHGKHVLCEKPMACTKEEGELMAAVAAENHVLLMEAFMYRYGENFRKLNEILSSGRLGKTVGMQGNHGYTLDWASPAREDPKLGGGCLYDVGCYVIDCMNYVMGKQDAKVASGSASLKIKGGVDWHAAADVQYDDGVCACIQSWFDGAQEQRMLIVGEKDVCVIPDIFEPAEGEELYRVEAEEFSRAIRGEQSYIVPLEDTMRNLEVLEMLLSK